MEWWVAVADGPITDQCTLLVPVEIKHSGLAKVWQRSRLITKHPNYTYSFPLHQCLNPKHRVPFKARSLSTTIAMPMSEAELKRLAHSEYWDDRYAEVGPDEQVHEWFKSFKDLSPFFDRHLFQVRGPETAPNILHLGSGDSVSPLGRFPCMTTTA